MLMFDDAKVRDFIDQIAGVFFYALVRIAPIVFSCIGTWATGKSYFAGSIDIGDSISRLTGIYAACGGLHVAGILVRTKTAEIANAKKPAADVPNLPPIVASLATGLEKETSRETGNVKTG